MPHHSKQCLTHIGDFSTFSRFLAVSYDIYTNGFDDGYDIEARHIEFRHDRMHYYFSRHGR